VIWNKGPELPELLSTIAVYVDGTVDINHLLQLDRLFEPQAPPMPVMFITSDIEDEVKLVTVPVR
jgi:hypothetical protein